MWNTSRDRIDDFLLKANSFHPAIKFTPEISETETTFLDTKVYKVVRFNKVNKVSILDVQTHFKTTETFQYKNMSNFKTRLQNRGYPTRIVEKHLSEIKFSDREMSLAQKNKTARKKILSFVTQYHTTLSNLKDTLMGKWHLIDNQPRGRGVLGSIFAGYVPLASQNPFPILVTFGLM